MKYDIEKIQSLLTGTKKFSGDGIYYFEEINSTNSWLLEQPAVDGLICIAESQRAGRGRRGNRWIDAGEGSITLSLGLELEAGRCQGLSLVSGLAVINALESVGVTPLSLKWPNDIMLDGLKLGGILVELAAGKCVVGIGLNLEVDTNAATQIDQEWTDLTPIGRRFDRDVIVAELIRSHDELLIDFVINGFDDYVEAWNARHLYQDQPLRIQSPSKELCGIARGVDRNGSLLLEDNGNCHRIAAGIVSVRPMQTGPTGVKST